VLLADEQGAHWQGIPLSWSSFFLYCNAVRYIMPASAVQIVGTTFTLRPWILIIRGKLVGSKGIAAASGKDKVHQKASSTCHYHNPFLILDVVGASRYPFCSSPFVLSHVAAMFLGHLAANGKPQDPLISFLIHEPRYLTTHSTLTTPVQLTKSRSSVIQSYEFAPHYI
jgi:hypothetical protein